MCHSIIATLTQYRNAQRPDASPRGAKITTLIAHLPVPVHYLT